MIPDYPRLNFPAVKLRISQRGEQMTVWDPLRGIYLVLTPEEWVRRHLIGFLISHCGAQPMRIVQEYKSVVRTELEGKLMIRNSCTAADEGGWSDYCI